jgi:hypothetical protein
MRLANGYCSKLQGIYLGEDLVYCPMGCPPPSSRSARDFGSHPAANVCRQTVVSTHLPVLRKYKQIKFSRLQEFEILFAWRGFPVDIYLATVPDIASNLIQTPAFPLARPLPTSISSNPELGVVLEPVVVIPRL